VGLLTAISTGVGAPRFITRLTMSLGSNENLTPGRLAASFARSRSFNASSDAEPRRSCTCMTLSSGPPVHR
jgi:hypothetical protein